MLLPSLFGENLFDEMMNFDFDKELERMTRPLYGKHNKNMMKTDVRETDNSYELDIDLPGFKKDEINVQLDNGYLSISAAKGLDKDEKEKETGKFVRQERYAGSMSRSFYIGENVKEDDIHAKYESGVLKINIPKEEAKEPEAEKTDTSEMENVPLDEKGAENVKEASEDE